MMFKILIQLLIIFVLLSIGTVVSTKYLDIEFLHKNYWDHHGPFLLLGLATFPRLTLLFSNIASGGIIWWLSWLLAPRLLVATLATLSYWHQHPWLVAFAWLIAIGGESSEKYVFVRKARGIQSMSQSGEVIDVSARRID